MMKKCQALTPDNETSLLLSVAQVASLLSCSARHVYRLCDTQRIPPPVRLGTLVRWRKGDIEAWIAAGCPAQRHVESRK